MITRTAGIDLLSVGSWAIFDHFGQLAAYPREGQTIEVTSPLERLEVPLFGDCSANVAVVAAALGTHVGLAMGVGDDFVSSGYDAHLRALGIDLTAVEVHAGRRSGHNFLFSDASGEGFCLSHIGVAAEQDSWRVPEATLVRARALVVSERFGPYTLDALERAKARGALTAVNGMVATAGRQVSDFLRVTDLLFIARSELRDLLLQLGLEGPEGLLALGPQRLFVTHGQDGSETFGEDGCRDIPTVPAGRVIDATGAGDAYVAGTLSAWLRGLPPTAAAQVGATVASFVVEAWGAQGRLPTWSEMEARRDVPGTVN